MKSNRFSGAEITAIICVVLLMSGIVPAQAQTDYQVKTDAGVSTYRILTAKSEIEAKLNAERGLVSPGMPDLSQVPWRQITRWRLDPVVPEPLKSVEDIKRSAETIGLAIEKSLLIDEAGKKELKAKVAAGDCKLGPIRSRFFEAMVNKSSIVWKGEITEDLAGKTQACEFFIPSVNTVVALVMDCGNFTFFFNVVQFTAKVEEVQPKPKPVVAPPPPKEAPKVPVALRPATCDSRIAPKVVRNADETIRVRFSVSNPDNIAFRETVSAFPEHFKVSGREFSVRRGDHPQYSGPVTFSFAGFDRATGKQLFACSESAMLQSIPEPEGGMSTGAKVGIVAAVVGGLLCAWKCRGSEDDDLYKNGNNTTRPTP